MDFKFLHAADIHLDSPLCGLEHYDGAPVEWIRLATRRAFENMVDLAIAEQVQFVLIAGDIYDSEWKDYNTGLFFAKGLSKLQAHQIRVFVISGNHDAASQITLSLRLPQNTYTFPMHNPETVLLPDLKVAIHGQGFAQKEVKENMALQYPQKEPDFFNIGVLHTSATGREGHAPYAPCRVEDMLSKDYDYWALGHIHTREVLHESPWIVFPGNLQGRHIGERGPKGCTVVTVKDHEVTSVEHKTVSVFQWETCHTDVSGLPSGDAVVEAIVKNELIQSSKSFPLGIRLTLSGTCEAHSQLVQSPNYWLEQIQRAVQKHLVWIEQLQLQTTSDFDFTSLASRNDPLGWLLQTLNSQEHVDLQEEMLTWIREIKEHSPTEFQKIEAHLQLSDTENLQALQQSLKHFLLPQLLS